VTTVITTGAQASATTTALSTPTTGFDTTGMTLLVVGTANYHAGGNNDAATPLTDSKGNTYVRIGRGTSGTEYCNLFYCNSNTPIVGANHYWTYNVLSADFTAMAVLCCDTSTATPLDVGSNSTFNGANPGLTLTTVSATTTLANEILVAMYGDADDANVVTTADAGSTAVPGGTWTAGSHVNGAAGQGYYMAYALTTATGTYAVKFTSDTSTELVTGIASFKLTGLTTNTRPATNVSASLFASSLTHNASPISAAMQFPGQHSQPSADGARGGWTTQSGGTTNLYAQINETPASDTNYVQSSLGPASDQLTVAMAALSTPVSGARTLTYRYSKDTGTSERIDLTVELLQGTTVVQSWVHTNIPTGWTQSPDQAITSTITDYTILNVRFTANQV
jgi:hypothetical protein